LRITIIVLLAMLPVLLLAQDKTWIEGRVVSSDSLLPLQHVHVISKMARTGTITDTEGRFVIRTYNNDTMMFSSVGFRYLILPFDERKLDTEGLFRVRMAKDTVKMEEVVVRAYYDWETFKYLFVNMKTIKPVELERLREELGTSLLYVRPAPLTIKGPIQALYDLFNDMARLQRRLERNRKWYNEQMIREGRAQDTIPMKPDHVR
jgi:iron complex outermembrane receptor protein